MSFDPRNYPGAAVQTTTSTTLDTAGVTLVVLNATGWPSEDFVIVIDPGTSTEEKLLIDSRVGTTLTVNASIGRGYDGTSPQSHQPGAQTWPTWDAVSAQESNRTAVETIGRIAAKGDSLWGTGANSLVKLAVGIDGEPLQADSATASGVSYGPITQDVSHESPDTDSGPAALHHTLGGGANAAAAGTHSHSVLGSAYVQTVPAGTVHPFAGSAAPADYLLCDGAAVSRATYAVLFAVTGTTYGIGDGSTTFNLPNMKGRIPVGRDAAQAEFDVLGETGGAKTKTLAVDELPAHAHSIDHDHASATSSTQPVTDILDTTGGLVTGKEASDALPGTALNVLTDSTGAGAGGGKYQVPAHSHTVDLPNFTGNSGSQGSGTAFSILDPYLVLNYIIKT